MSARSLPPAWRDALDALADDMASEGRAPSTIATRMKYLRSFIRDTGSTDPWVVVLDDMTAWVASHARTETSASSYRQALRMFYAWAERTGRVAVSPALYLDGANGGRPVARREARPVGRSGPLPAWTPQAWEGPIGAWSREQIARGLSKRTLRPWASYLRRLAREHPHRGPFDVTFHDLVDFMAARDDWSADTRRSCRSAFRGFYAWAHEAGHVEVDPAAKLPRVVSKPPMPRPASETAVHFAALAATPRERLMVRLAAELGMRRNEVAQVHSRDLIEHDTGWSLIVHGKGARDRVLPLHDELTAELRNLPDGWAFPSPVGGHLSGEHVGVLVKRLLPDGVTMHALRHRFATRAYEMTRDVFVVQQLLGHARPETTRRYVEVADDRLRAAVVNLARTTTRSATPIGAR